MRLIDADTTKVSITRYFETHIRNLKANHSLIGNILKAQMKEVCTDVCFGIDAQPTVDAEPKWIPCSERLPEHGVHVLATCFIKMFDGTGHYYVCDAFHTEHFTETCNYDDEIDMEYNEEEDEYYMPEGWWEVIKNWDDYSCVAIADHVTHWMPLPKPYKMDGKEKDG